MLQTIYLPERDLYKIKDIDYGAELSGRVRWFRPAKAGGYWLILVDRGISYGAFIHQGSLELSMGDRSLTKYPTPGDAVTLVGADDSEWIFLRDCDDFLQNFRPSKVAGYFIAAATAPNISVTARLTLLQILTWCDFSRKFHGARVFHWRSVTTAVPPHKVERAIKELCSAGILTCSALTREGAWAPRGWDFRVHWDALAARDAEYCRERLLQVCGPRSGLKWLVRGLVARPDEPELRRLIETYVVLASGGRERGKLPNRNIAKDLSVSEKSVKRNLPSPLVVRPQPRSSRIAIHWEQVAKLVRRSGEEEDGVILSHNS